MHILISEDLSSNKLTGTLVQGYQPASSSLDLRVNRLSGAAPLALRESNAKIDVLEGNIFGCPLLSNDASSRTTSCGSSNLEYPFIAWFVMSIFVVVIATCLPYFSTNITKNVKRLLSEWWDIAADRSNGINRTELYHTRSTISYLDHASSTAVILILLFVLVAMVSFIVIKLQSNGYANYSMYQVQYLYTTTAAYLVGGTPAVLIWLYVTLSGLLVTVLCIARKAPKRFRYDVKRIDNNEESEGMHAYQDSFKSFTVRLVVELVVSALAIAINYGFVRIVYFGNQTNLTIINLAFAVIKSLVSVTVIPYSTTLVSNSYKQSHAVFMTIMFNVISPGLAVLLSSPLCLFYKFSKRSISASYDYPIITCPPHIGCEISGTVSADSVITPEWFYSYQCSSSFLTSYLPNFVYLYMINGILSPLLNLSGMIVISTGVATKFMEHVKQQFKTFDFLLHFTGDKLKVGRIFYIDNGNVEVTPASISPSVEMSVLNIRSSSDAITLKESSTVIELRDASIVSKSIDSEYDISIAGLVPNLCVDITMLLTFGIASPLFAVIVACNILINTLLWRLALGRYIAIVSKAISAHVCYEKLERAFEDEWRCLRRSWWLMSVFIGLFWSLFVNDMIGDNDPKGGIVAAVLMMIWCPCVFISLQLLLSVDPDTDSNDSASGSKLHKIRQRVHGMSSRVHDIIWKHVLRLDSISNSTSGSDDINSGDMNNTINETISPLGSLNITTNTTPTTTTTTVNNKLILL